MKKIGQELQAHLDTRTTTMCHCWRITRRDGIVQGFTEHDRDLVFDGTLFLARSGFTATEVQSSLGLAVDNLSVEGALSSETINEDDLAAGRYDDALIEIFRVNWRNPSQRVLVAAGYTGETTRLGGAFSAELRGLSSRLAQTTIRTFQRTCDAVLGDSRCRVNLATAAYKGTGEIVEATGPRTLRASGLDRFNDDWFSQGALTFVSSGTDPCIISGQGLIVNAFHEEVGRGGYFSPASGTSEGQFLMIAASIRAARVLETRAPLAAASFGSRARKMTEASWAAMYGGRKPTEIAASDLFIPHWLFAARSRVRLRRVELAHELAFAAHAPGQLRGVLEDDQVVRVYQVYDQGGRLLWENPYSPILDGQAYPILSPVEFDDAAPSREIIIAAATPGTYKVVYTAADGPWLAEGSPYEAWPAWRDLEQGEIDCAADTLRWAYDAYREMAEFYPGDALYAAARELTAAAIPDAFAVDDGKYLFRKHPQSYGLAESGLYTFASGRTAAWARNAQGFIEGTIGAVAEGASGEAQLGRGYDFDLGEEDTIRIVVEPGAERTYFYVDTAASYSTATRFYFPLSDLFPGGVASATLSPEDFRRLDHADNATLASVIAGWPLHIHGAGFVSRDPSAHRLVIYEVRPLPRIWLPYQPWVVPFTVNMIEGEIIDWRGSPGTGYQGPDLWGWLGEPKGAEVQCDFLRAGQVAWATDVPPEAGGPIDGGSAIGPFAHCYVWDRPDKSEFGDPDADTWIYTWHDPNSFWGGYQYRPLEATARLLFEKGDDPAFANAIAAGLPVVRDYLAWLNHIGWPSLAGPVAGPPTEYRESGVSRSYEEPHFAAYILRAALYAAASNQLPSGAQADARDLISRAWDYLQVMYVTSGDMKGTWSNDPPNRVWYGFWHAEIILTLVLLFEESFAGIVAERGIDLRKAERMLVESDAWLTANTRPQSQNDGTSFDVKRHLKDAAGEVWIELWHPPAFPLEAGATFHVTAGCKLTARICATKFDNIANFQGFPLMPGSDAIIRNARREAENAGGSRFTSQEE